MPNRLNIDQLHLHHLFQPIIHTVDKTHYAYEAFLRSASCSNPLQLFDNARRHNQLYSLDTTSIEKAVSVCHAYIKNHVFLNVFPSSLLQNSFFDLLESLDEQYHKICTQIVLEINESNDDHEAWKSSEFNDRINELRKRNIPFALDDVGTGQASLHKLIELAPDYVKIDRFFSKHLADSTKKQKIVSFFVDYCQNHSKLILEGIETEQDLNTATDLGVEYVQGFFFGKPNTIEHYHQNA
ncbi:EAL domain-containing protein [Bacillus tianshenii]|nr:EAL domain-containing protein [Bacillus tianshenii]